jgi:glycosyltransferase involved in cell wall biosynthesis
MTHNKNSKISIVTPSFNRGWSIKFCIQSLQNQTFTNYEHIIVDGGSDDGTLDILREVVSTDTRVKYISEPDHGMYDAVNKGLSMASSDIVAYLNTDDFYFPNTLEKVIGAFAEDPNLSMLYGHWVSWHPETGFLEILPVLNYTPADLAAFAVLPQPSVFFKRKVFESLGGFDLFYKLLGDNDFFSKTAVAGFKFKRINEYLSIQTVHSGNLLAGNSEAILKAKNEGSSYRLARQHDYLFSDIDYFNKKKAILKKTCLPIIWRFNLIFIWVLRLLSNSSKFNFGGEEVKSRFSLYLFIKYLMSGTNRHRFSYNKIERFSLPCCIKSILPDVNDIPSIDKIKND